MVVWILKHSTEHRLLGIFSSREKAQEEARQILIDRSDLDDDFYWDDRVRFLIGYNGERPWDTDEFMIVPLELDKIERGGYAFP